MAEKRLYYPVIVTECNDEAGHYYGVSSPNIPGMVTDGKTMEEAILHAEDAIATMLADMTDYPAVQDPSNWHLGSHDRIMWVSINMAKWMNQYGRTVRRNISIPEILNNWAKDNKINVSQVTTNALRKLREGWVSGTNLSLYVE